MKTKWMTSAALVFALSSSLAFGLAPVKPVQSNGAGHANQYHDRTPHVHERGVSTPH